MISNWLCLLWTWVSHLKPFFMTRNQFSNLSHTHTHTHTHSWLIINFLFSSSSPFLLFDLWSACFVLGPLNQWEKMPILTSECTEFLLDYGPIILKLQLLPPKATHGGGSGIWTSQSSKVRMSGGRLKLWIDWHISACQEYLLYFLIQLACFNFRIFVSET